jgi:hypothetical protein
MPVESLRFIQPGCCEVRLGQHHARGMGLTGATWGLPMTTSSITTKGAAARLAGMINSAYAISAAGECAYRV